MCIRRWYLGVVDVEASIVSQQPLAHIDGWGLAGVAGILHTAASLCL